MEFLEFVFDVNVGGPAELFVYGPYAIQSRDTYLELEPSLSLT